MITYGPSPRMGQHHTKRSALSLQFLHVKTEQNKTKTTETRVDGQLPQDGGHFLGAPTLNSPHGALTGNLIVMEKGGKAATARKQILAEHIPTGNTRVSSPRQQFCSSAEPRQWHRLTRKLGGV